LIDGEQNELAISIDLATTLYFLCACYWECARLREAQ
jgi:hypothetical protein